jgi:hypothetical protein
MDIIAILSSKELKGKEKTEQISNLVLSKQITPDDLAKIASTLKPADKGTCIEALEFATHKHPELLAKKSFDFIVESLEDKAPRVKWESARVIGNTAKLFQENLKKAIHNLLNNTGNEGTVVRWSAAFALGEIIKLGTAHNKELIPLVEEIIEKEEKNSIKKIYLNALKKARK